MSDEEIELRRGEEFDNDDACQLPAFVGKLSRMMADPNCRNSICWGENGSTIVIPNQADFTTVGRITFACIAYDTCAVTAVAAADLVAAVDVLTSAAWVAFFSARQKRRILYHFISSTATLLHLSAS
jgi:hypothetical protein